jgi:RNA-directed DNA polymerase
MHLVKQSIKVGGKLGVPQGGPFSPLAANIYLNEGKRLVNRCCQ